MNVMDTLGHAMWNRIIFNNDPDVVFIRSENCTLTENQKYLIANVDELFGSQFMYSDDPGKAGKDEEIISNNILAFSQKFQNEEFGITQISSDVYKIFSKSGKYKGIIDLGKNCKMEITEV